MSEREQLTADEDCGCMDGKGIAFVHYCPTHKAAFVMRKALEEIAKREGAFSRDPLTHCQNTVDSMEAIATAALAQARPQGSQKPA